jgi:hypothetical protein
MKRPVAEVSMPQSRPNEGLVDAGAVEDLTTSSSARFQGDLLAAEQTGLRPRDFDPAVAKYLDYAKSASEHGYTVVFLCVAAIAFFGLCVTGWLVRPPPVQPEAI